MKKILLTTLLICFGLSAAQAADYAGGSLPPGFGPAYADMTGLQNTNSQLELLEQQNFRRTEYNEFQDMKQVKAARNKKIELEQQMEKIDKSRPIYDGNSNLNFVRENGKLMLKRID